MCIVKILYKTKKIILNLDFTKYVPIIVLFLKRILKNQNPDNMHEEKYKILKQRMAETSKKLEEIKQSFDNQLTIWDEIKANLKEKEKSKKENQA